MTRGLYIRLFPKSLFASCTHLNQCPIPLLFPPRGVGLIWSAKSACTTSILWYLAVAGLLKEALAYDPWPHNYRQKVLPESARYQAWLMNTDPHKLAWVRVIRDPYKHAVLQNAYRSDFTVAGGKTPPAKTTNDIKQDTKSPMTDIKRMPRPATFATPRG